ncbi:MAG: hypothetical protein IKU40_12390 [Clostridia bacterium]|nr:hypothetical protein [Clostridia bacterium]
MPYNTTGFSEYLARLMKSRGLSTGELAALLGLKSKTTIVRILNSNAGEKSILNFRNLLMNSRELALTTEEVQMLDESVSCQTKESSYSFIFSELWALLYRRDTPHGEVRLLTSEPYATLKEFGCMLREGPAEFLLINCSFSSLTGAAREFLETQEHPVSMEQYFFNADGYPRRLVQIIGRIVPILPLDNYTAYTITQEPEEGIFDLNAVAVRTGAGEEYELLFCSERTAILTRGEGLFRKWQTFLANFRTAPIKSRKDPGTYNFIGFMERYRKLEERSDLCKFRPDISINCIPIDIMEAAFVEGCRSMDIPVPKETVTALVALQRKRYNNVHSSRQTSHLVISEKAMRKFAATGRIADHAYMMRPFTGEERIRILKDCADRSGRNSENRFHIYLLDPETEERIYGNDHPVEMVCYGEKCVQLTPAQTDYNFGKGHSEIFIEQEAFRGLFVEFFMNDLVQYHTQPEEATEALFRELIRELEEEENCSCIRTPDVL